MVCRALVPTSHAARSGEGDGTRLPSPPPITWTPFTVSTASASVAFPVEDEPEPQIVANDPGVVLDKAERALRLKKHLEALDTTTRPVGL